MLLLLSMDAILVIYNREVQFTNNQCVVIGGIKQHPAPDQGNHFLAMRVACQIMFHYGLVYMDIFQPASI